MGGDNEMKRTIIFLCLLPIIASCTSDNDIYKILYEEWRKQDEKSFVFDFTKSMGFVWDTMYVYSGKCSLEDINNDLGLNYIQWEDTGMHIIFVKDKNIVFSQAWYSVEYNTKEGIDFINLDDKLKFNYNDAVFKVTKKGNLFVLSHIENAGNLLSTCVMDSTGAKLTKVSNDYYSYGVTNTASRL